MQINGACHCGSIKFTAEIDASRVMVCHCTDCQVLSGSPFRAVVAVPIGKFKLRGTPKSYVKVAQGGNRRAQCFCPECGTPLYATAPENPTSVVIRLGCVAERSQLSPTSQIWQHSALPWLSQLSAVPSSPEQQAFLPAPAP
ncbi:MAG: GFA family protein [Burkholderiaceae bacterium]